MKLKIKIAIDIFMTLLIPGLMAYQIIDEAGHEWLGMGMLVLFLAHVILNWSWYRRLFRGRYRLARALQTAVNLSVLIAMLCSGYSGIVLSRHVFTAVRGPMATARLMHMAASYWCFLLMGIHLGMHWAMIRGIITKAVGNETPVLVKTILRLASLAVTAFGLYCFLKNDIPAYLFLQKEFVFFDFDQPGALVFLEYIGMLFAWAAIGFWMQKAARTADGKKRPTAA